MDGILLVAPILITGSSSSANFESVGVLTSVGKVDTISFTFLCAFCNCISTSAAWLNCITTNETPSAEVEVTLSISSSVEIASSMGLVTEVSTSFGEAPG